ncbi:glycoside hydrolase family 88 protein, partial [Lachnospiraceae bacterium OttesenSCG-928-D06]|nr:glycoside hydrolase family 88 protein [Lachnospiraceae bacterium OttesenSCG-928-D06]
RYFAYIKDWVDSIINEEGEINWFDSGQLDDIQPGILLFGLLSQTGDLRYKKALDTLLPIIKNFPRNASGGFWHKDMFSHQMWLDGLYMAGPISAEYALTFQVPEYLELAIEQVLLMEEKTRDDNSGLWYHAWDALKKEGWADAETGRSPEFWGRSIGWVPMAILDELDFMQAEHPQYQKMCNVVRCLLKAICKYQSKEGRWYQVVDKGNLDGNWLENSSSCLYVAALSKAVRLGIIEKDYLLVAIRGYEAVIKDLGWDGDDLLLGGVCIGTGVGDYRHYCERPVSVNDLHGMGAFLLMCTEMHHVQELI